MNPFEPLRLLISELFELCELENGVGVAIFTKEKTTRGKNEWIIRAETDTHLYGYYLDNPLIIQLLKAIDPATPQPIPLGLNEAGTFEMSLEIQAIPDNEWTNLLVGATRYVFYLRPLNSFERLTELDKSFKEEKDNE
jgi:hypothetical protein